LLRNDNGGAALLFGLSVPLLFTVCWVAVNFAMMSTQRSMVQSAADAAALAAAQQFSLSQQSAANIQSTALGIAHANLPDNDFLASPDVVSANVDLARTTVTVSIKRTLNPIFGAWLGFSSNDLSASATASTNSSPICVLVLDPTSSAAFNAFANSNVTAPGCSIISDSSSATGLSGTTGGAISSAKACSAGGYVGGAFTPTPVTDCPVVHDPLAGRSPPANVNAGCDYNNFSFSGSAFSLSPGVYCGGMTIKKGTATLGPGDYIIRGGSLTINAGGAIQGSNVGIYLTGGAVLDGQPNSGISLTAPSSASDPMVGLVFWEDRNNMPAGSQATHKIWSDNAQNLHGTVYFPQGVLNLGGHANVGSASAYTIIVAYDLVAFQSANVVLNSNYSASNIPAPYGVGKTATGAVLTK
jgi:Flp pilus assembly protein TadG